MTKNSTLRHVIKLRNANPNYIRNPTWTRNHSGIKIGQSINKMYAGA
jgi:hypothetical protein